CGAAPRTRHVRRIEPAPAANDMKFTSPAHLRLAARRRIFVVFAAAICHPLPNVAEHVVEAKGVGRKTANGRCVKPSISTRSIRRTAIGGARVGVLEGRLLAPVSRR